MGFLDAIEVDVRLGENVVKNSCSSKFFNEFFLQNGRKLFEVADCAKFLPCFSDRFEIILAGNFKPRFAFCPDE